jgi:hypothetical protein
MYRLIYKSRSKSPIDWVLIDSILQASENNNPESEITGALLATRTHFLQVIEGSFETVNQLFCAIARDPRHDELQLVGFSCVEERVFPNWTMHGIGIFDLNQEIARRLREAYGEEDGDVRLPTREWQALALINDIRQAPG